MSLYGVLPLAILLLQQHGRVSYRGLKAQFDLDDAGLEALKEELFFRRVAVDEAGRGLVWAGAGATSIALAAADTYAAPPHLASEAWQLSEPGAVPAFASRPSGGLLSPHLLEKLLRVMQEARDLEGDAADLPARVSSAQTGLLPYLSAVLQVLEQWLEGSRVMVAELEQEVLRRLSTEPSCDHHVRHVRTDAWYLPDEPLLGFVEIPAGSFLMGSNAAHDADASVSEQPQHLVSLPRYYLARYPVTVAQFQTFIDASGYLPTCTDSLHGPANHPVVWVSWQDAQAYCSWLTTCLRKWLLLPAPLAEVLRYGQGYVTLPSEAEWEKAARGTDGRCYPWGDVPDPSRANYSAAGLNTTSAVGLFSQGASPYGIEDAAGNVWEWTRSLWGPYPYPAEGWARVKREAVQPSRTRPRVRRGGSFLFPRRSARCVARDDVDEQYVNRDLGFRVSLTVA